MKKIIQLLVMDVQYLHLLLTIVIYSLLLLELLKEVGIFIDTRNDQVNFYFCFNSNKKIVRFAKENSQSISMQNYYGAKICKIYEGNCDFCERNDGVFIPILSLFESAKNF